MAYNIFERWPFTSFQNLNLDWLMKATKEAVETANEAAGSVGQFDNRITANTDAIEQLEFDMDAISGTMRVLVTSELVAAYNGQPITGSQLRSIMLESDDLPYVTYNGEVYMLDTVSNAGDLRFSMCHTVDAVNEVVIRHILIPAQSYNAAYSITPVTREMKTLTVTITHQQDYTSDHSYAEINSALQAGKAILLNIAAAGTNAVRATSAMVQRTTVTVSGQEVGAFMFLDPEALNSSSPDIHYYVIREDGEVYYLQRYNDLVNMATLLANAVSVYPQELTAAQQATARTNIGLTYAVTPEMYGAVGDGIADDTAAVRAALSRPCVLLNGDYLITESINAAARVVSGSGTIRGNYGISFANDVQITGINMVMGNQVDVIALTLSGNTIVNDISITGGRKGIRHNTHHKTVVVTDSRFSNMWGDGARAVEVLFSYICKIENNFIENISNDLDRDADGVHVWQTAGAPNAIAEIKYNVFHNCKGRFIKASTYNITIEGNYCYNDTDFAVISYFNGIDVQKGNSTVIDNEIRAASGINISVRSTGDIDSHHVVRNNRLFKVGSASNSSAFSVTDYSNELSVKTVVDFSDNYIDWSVIAITVPYLPNSKYIIKNNTVENRSAGEAMHINTSSAFDATCRFEIEGNTCGYAYFVTFRSTDAYPNCKGDYKVRCEKALTFSELKSDCSFIALITGSALDGKFRNRSFVKTEGTVSYFTVFIMDEAHYGIYTESGVERLYLPAQQ